MTLQDGPTDGAAAAAASDDNAHDEEASLALEEEMEALRAIYGGDMTEGPSPGHLTFRLEVDGCSTLLLIDHMNKAKDYRALLQAWAAELGIRGLIVPLSSSRNVYVVLQGTRDSTQEWLKRLRTEKVDVDSQGRACRERCSTVLSQSTKQHTGLTTLLDALESEDGGGGDSGGRGSCSGGSGRDGRGSSIRGVYNGVNATTARSGAITRQGWLLLAVTADDGHFKLRPISHAPKDSDRNKSISSTSWPSSSSSTSSFTSTTSEAMSSNDVGWWVCKRGGFRSTGEFLGFARDVLGFDV